MAEVVTMNEIYEQLTAIKQDVNFIKKHVVDIEADMNLTAEEEALLEEGLKQHTEGKTSAWEDFKKERGK